jgi:hypothetical protein
VYSLVGMKNFTTDSNDGKGSCIYCMWITHLSCMRQIHMIIMKLPRSPLKCENKFINQVISCTVNSCVRQSSKGQLMPMCPNGKP